MQAEYLSCAATAKLIRAALKRAFPTTIFRVRSKTYSGGASIDVSWTDGPTERLAAAITDQYRGGSFDGSIDMAITHSSWLLPDGSATVAVNPGTSRSKGYLQPEDNGMPVPGCQLVNFGANYVFTNRAHSPAFAGRVLARVKERYGKAAELELKVSDFDGSAYLTGDMHMERIGREIASRLVIMRAAT